MRRINGALIMSGKDQRVVGTPVKFPTKKFHDPQPAKNETSEEKPDATKEKRDEPKSETEKEK
jgi:hypothetical protein